MARILPVLVALDPVILDPVILALVALAPVILALVVLALVAPDLVVHRNATELVLGGLLWKATARRLTARLDLLVLTTVGVARARAQERLRLHRRGQVSRRVARHNRQRHLGHPGHTVLGRNDDRSR